MRPKSVVSFDFTGGVDQSKGARHLPAGKMVTMENVRQLKAGEYRKRKGFSYVSPSPYGAGSTFVNGVRQDMGFGGTNIQRDDVGQMWAWPQGSAMRRFLGMAPRAVPEYQFANLSQAHGNSNGYTKPISLACGTSTFTCAITADPIFVGDDRITWTVTDGSGVLVTRGPGAQNVGGGARVECLTACYEPVTNQALVFYSIGLVVFLLRIDVADGFTRNITTYRTVTMSAGGGTRTITSLDSQRLLTTGEVVVSAVARADAAAFTVKLDVSLLDTATWIADTSPAPYQQQVTALTDSNVNMTSVVVSSGSNGSLYVAWLRSTNGAAGLYLVRLLQITISTLALVADTLVFTDTIGATGGLAAGGVCGYLRSDNVRQLFWQAYAGNLVWYAVGVNWAPEAKSYSWDGASAVNTGSIYSQWIASKPCRKPTGLSQPEWFMATGFDDGESRKLQRSLYLRRLPDAAPSGVVDNQETAYGQIASTALQGNASAAWHNYRSPVDAATARTLIAAVPSAQYGFAPPPLTMYSPAGLSQTRMVMGAMIQSGQQYLMDPLAIVFDLDAQLSQPATLDNQCVFPGGVPCIVGADDPVRELVPMIFPERAMATAGTVTVQAVYVLTDSIGRRYRSSPGPATLATLGGTVTIPGCNITLTQLTYPTGLGIPVIHVELYAKVTAGGGTMQLQYTLQNNPAAGCAFNLPAALLAGEVLYTEGGSLSNASAPPCRTVALWRNRVVLSGTDEPGDIWPTQEMEQGFGPRFSEVLVTEWNDGSGPIYGTSSVDWNYLAFFRRDAIGVISGAGPDGIGRGGYVSQTLTTRKGLSNGRAVTSGPGGAYFQNFADFKACIVTPGLQVVDIGQGIDSLVESFTTAVHYEKDRLVLFGKDGTFGVAGDGGIYALDYAHPLPDQPAGQWYKWHSAYLESTAANFGFRLSVTHGSSGTLVTHGYSSGVFYQADVFTDSDGFGAGQILMKLKTSKLAPFGGLQMEGMVDTVQPYVSAPSGTMRVSVAADSGADETHSYSGAIDSVAIRPANCMNCKEVEVTIEETTSGGEGPIFSGIAMVVKPADRIANLPVTGRIA